MPDIGNFDATIVPNFDSYVLLPVGEYVVSIVHSELVPTRDQRNTRLVLKFSVLEGQYQGSQFTEGLNWQHENKLTEEISRRVLASICRAVGLTSIRRTEELYGRPFIVGLTVRRNEKNGREYNAINTVRALDRAGSVQQTITPAPWTQPAAPVQGGPVWKQPTVPTTQGGPVWQQPAQQPITPTQGSVRQPAPWNR